MRRLWWLSLCLLSCSYPSESPTQAQESVHPQQALLLARLEAFFQAATDYDFGGMQAICTSDFEFVERQESWSLPELMEFMDPDRGRIEVRYTLSPQRVRVRAPLAWMYFQVRAEVYHLATGQPEPPIYWQEVALFERIEGNWKLQKIEARRLAGSEQPTP